MASPLHISKNRPNRVTQQWDDWVPQDRVRKFTEENKELAAQLHNQMKVLQQKAPKSGKKKGGTNGSDFSSARGSEERTTSGAQSGRGGQRRARDYEIENVSTFPPLVSLVFVLFGMQKVFISQMCSLFATRFSILYLFNFSQRVLWFFGLSIFSPAITSTSPQSWSIIVIYSYNSMLQCRDLLYSR
jgi:hypothetical protein